MLYYLQYAPSRKKVCEALFDVSVAMTEELRNNLVM